MVSVDQWQPFKETDFTSNKQLQKLTLKNIILLPCCNITDEFNKTCARPVK